MVHFSKVPGYRPHIWFCRGAEWQHRSHRLELIEYIRHWADLSVFSQKRSVLTENAARGPGRRRWPDQPSALLAALEESVGDTVDPRDTVHQAGDPTDQRQRAEQARRRHRGDHEHTDRLVGVSVGQPTQTRHHRAAP